nr:macrophage mannose receptor 1-like [Nothobranchius furzeri]
MLTIPTFHFCFQLLWIGWYDDVNSWRWSMSDPNFYQHDETFRLWVPGEPNNYAGIGESCAKIRTTGQWGDFICSSTEYFICFNVNAFIFISTKKNWTDAQSYCRQHHTDLASVRNLSENQQVKQLITSGQAAWIGLYRDTWKWSDGSNSSFTYWRSGEPNGGTENCGAANLDVSGGWEDTGCEKKNYFVCYSGESPSAVFY